MADHSELQAKLAELDHELEEGDITQKGYEKRRTVLLSRYLGPEQTEQLQGRLRIHSVDEESSPSNDGSRNASLAALTGNQYPTYQPTGYPSQPPSQVGRFHERELGVPRQAQRQSSTGNLRPHTPDTFNDYSSRGGTMVGSDYRFNPAEQPGYKEDQGGYRSPGAENSRLSTMMDSQQGYFADFAGQQMGEPMRDSYGGPNRYSADPAMSPSAVIPPPMQDLQGPGFIECQLPLEPRDIPFDSFDPHNGNVPLSKFDNIGTVLRHRGKTNSKQPAYWVLDQKGKEIASITWEKLASRAEKVAQVIKDKSNLYRGDRVALVYRDAEVIDFAVALMGCFLAGVVAVPMNNVEDYQKLSLLLTTTQAHLALTTDNNLKAFQRDIGAQRLKWPTGVEWWKTNEFGSYHPKKKDDGPQLPAPDLAYIEFSRAPTGDLRGVVLSHRTIMHQMACLQAIVSTVPTGKGDDIYNPNTRRADGSFVAPIPRSGAETITTYLDPREGVGLIIGVLLGVYGGHTTIWFEPKTVETPGLYAHLVTKYRTTIMAGDYPGLKRTAYNYQQDPMATRNFKKNAEPNFMTVKICLIDTLTVDCEFHEILADRWFRPLRNPRARDVVAPMLCLPEHGGMVISIRDWLGGEERMGCPLSKIDEDDEEEKKPLFDSQQQNGYSSLIGGGIITKTDKRKSRTQLSEVLLDKEALKTNEVLVVAMGDEVPRRANDPGVLRVGAFGYPIPDATLAIVDPETSLLCPPYAVGEIWVDSPSLSGGFWALPKHTETIFHARPYRFVEGSPTPVLVEPEFLRTGLLGCIIEGKVYVLGLYEDRIRQRVDWMENPTSEEHRHFFVQHLVISIMKNVLKIYDCSAFDCHVNGEYLPIILVETQAASTAPTTAGGPPRQLDIPYLESLSERVMEVLYTEHRLRVYCVMVTAPNTLPRIMKNGRREIGNMLCRKEFDNGTLACVHVKFGVERSVQNIPIGDDPEGGVWSVQAQNARASRLMMQDKQYSGVDYREVVIDDRTSTPLNQFSNIFDLMQLRVARHGEELAYCTIDGRGKEGKGVNWKKFDQKVCAVAMYLKNKVKIQPGDRLLLMYTHSEEFVFAVHACFCVGAVAIPTAPLDQNRLSEDAPALLYMIADFKIKAILVNHEVDQVLRAKPVSQHLKQSAQHLRINLPNTYNTTKPPKQNHGCRDNGLSIKSQWVKPGWPVLVWVYWSPDQRRQAIQLGHDTIMAICKVQKETCQMTSTRPILGCVRSTMGIGFIHTCLMGIFLAAPTYLVSPVEFAANPNVLFQTLSRYKIKDTYATSQMLDHGMAHGAGKGGQGGMLHELKNLMITTDNRPRVDVYQKVRLHFAAAGLDRTAINTIYSHVLNPMVASRSYMCIEPIELWLDTGALRLGMVCPVHPDTDPTALLIQDSGMVPVSTQISIVNPDTNMLCLNGEYGEIWVQSEANAPSFYSLGPMSPLDAYKFQGRTVDGDPNVRYLRTGDLGFLHTVSRPIGPGGAPVEMQILFVLGSIGESFEVMGLLHFPMDIEASVERCHRNIVPGGCAIIQAGGLVVVIVEIFRKNFLASIVPVIVNAVLNTHHIVVDIVSFVSKGDFPRSRLGEKQRGRILSSWVSGKLRTIAQFGIRDPDLAEKLESIGVRNSQIEGRNSKRRSDSSQRRSSSRQRSLNRNGTLSGSLKQPSSAGSTTVASTTPKSPKEPTMQSMQHLSITEDQYQEQSEFSVAELPAGREIAELPSADQSSYTEQEDFTPTDASQLQPSFPDPTFNPPIPSPLQPGNSTLAAEFIPTAGITPPTDTVPDPLHYSPIYARGPFSDERAAPKDEYKDGYDESPIISTAVLADPGTAAVLPSKTPEPPMPKYGSKPYLHGSQGSGDRLASPSHVRTPGGSGDWGSLPSQQRARGSVIHSPQSGSGVTSPVGMGQAYSPSATAAGGGGGGGLRVMNRNSTMSDRSGGSEISGHERAFEELGRERGGENGEDEEWKRDAMAGLHLAGVGGAPGYYGN